MLTIIILILNIFILLYIVQCEHFHIYKNGLEISTNNFLYSFISLLILKVVILYFKH